MHINENLLDAVKKVAIIVTLHIAASTVARPTVGHEAAKEELTKLIKAELCGESTVVLILDSTASASVVPLYRAFGSDWATPRVRAWVIPFLREHGVKLDIQMRTR